MENRYLYKAKRADNGAWVQGYYAVLCKKSVIIQDLGEKQEVIEVDPSTLCQCTGLQDTNGILIWERDFVTLPTEEAYFIVCWEESCANFSLESETLVVNFDNYWGCQTEVIGNTFDNRELLGEEEEDE